MSENKTEIRFVGFGGQGIILAAHITGRAITIYEKSNATLTQNYGPESRGGSCAAGLIISDQAINYPHLTKPDVLVALSPEGYNKYKDDIKPGGLIIVEESILVDKKSAVRTLTVPAGKLAEQIGKKFVTNMVVLGFMTAAAKFVNKEAMRQSIASSVPPGTEELNLKAFEMGYSHFKPE
ncbi:MAG: 2-oxoacid:acceptor oxidoreductase family protein [Candidatus Brocadiia bacterium]